MSLQPPPLHWIAINLDARTDRWEQLQRDFPDQSIERFSALTDSDPEIACRKSHLAVIELAKERNYPWVAVLEDDCCPYPEFQQVLPRVLSYLWEHRSEWEIYNGGPGHIQGMIRLGNGFIKISDWISTQFLIIQASAYDKILSHDPAHNTKKIDAFYSASFQTFTSAPMLTKQHDTYSDLAKEVTYNATLFESTRQKLLMFR